MKDDYFYSLEYLGLTARLKRISDNLLYSAKELYKELELDIDPNWHLVFMMFKDREVLTMTEIADKFKISQIAVIKIINNMKKKGYLLSVPDKNDKRRNLLRLSEKALSELPKLEKVWEAGKKSIEEIIDKNRKFLDELYEIESQVNRESYKDRVLKFLEN